jgi:hypothetical protein
MIVMVSVRSYRQLGILSDVLGSMEAGIMDHYQSRSLKLLLFATKDEELLYGFLKEIMV